MKNKDTQLLKSLGKRVKELRKEAGMSQTDLAFKAGLEQYHISKIENGTNSASITTLDAIAKALKKSLIDLLTLDKEKK